MARSLNKVQLIGNLTRDPELRYTPQGTAVCSFGLATNRQWTTDAGEKREDAEFHRIVAWQKLAELCAQLLTKGRKVFVEGRLQTRRWQTQDGQDRMTTEIVINDMIILDSRGQTQTPTDEVDIPDADLDQIDNFEAGTTASSNNQSTKASDVKSKKITKKTTKKQVDKKTEDESEDIPF
ncbi:hypothetical protein A2Z22_00550 [Candidatus Woesebacteria bacterium RBG_16_34_12]|uniref:Single-stranded DNA-binding protein n=1 Tax=Candidatus Woesebacteria bacterium RBG_16_34_12 TaxID=1802480 RepID=A0A1F7X922_9BACT|nr:MAG: hypothetical protein A2Z22_00550 [Candidatus Woesebacteria bacterium RBG_16_34_12]